MLSLVLYNAPQSTCSQRVRFTLHEKGLSFSEIKLDLFSGDQLRPYYFGSLLTEKYPDLKIS